MKNLTDKDQKLFSQIEKVIVNTGVGRISGQADFENKVLPEIIKEISMMTGQNPQIIKSEIAISSFKLRIGQISGLRTTLRRGRAVDFLKRLINIVLPRIKDFRGLKSANIDRSGVLNIGLKDKSVFPEILPEESRVNFGISITIVPRIKNRDKAVELFKEMRIPIKYG